MEKPEINPCLLQVPSRLLIQVPRFGREFKTYQKIVPDLKLRITELTDPFKAIALASGGNFVIKMEVMH